MNVSIFDNRRVRQGLTVLLLAGSLACIFPPGLPVFQWWAGRAVFVSASFLLLGLFFLTINKSRLMFVCMGCSAAICFFKNEMNEKAHLNHIPTPNFYPSDTLPPKRPARDSVTIPPFSTDEPEKTRR